MNKPSKGFTLVEILVALTILAITMGAYLTQLDQQITQSQKLKNRTMAHWVAQNHLAQMRIEARWPNTGSLSINMQQGQQTWHVQQLISYTPNATIRRVELKVTSDTGDFSGALVGYIHRAE
jgi:general secretion pathway protein I